MIWSIFKKDWTLLWPLAVLVTLIQIALEGAVFKFSFFGGSPLAAELLKLLTPAWFIGVIAVSVAVVQEDTVPGVDQDWLIRPLQRSDLLIAKMLFVVVTVLVPMLIVNVTHELILGFPVVPSVGDALYKEAYLFICLLIPAMALSSATRNMRDLVVLVAGLLVLYVASLWLSAGLFGSARCPTCDTSISWIQHLMQHIGLLTGSAVILWLQYYRRKTAASRVLLAAGVVLLVIAQLPWNMAFALQTWLGAPLGTPPANIQVAADATEVDAGSGKARGAQADAKRARQALMQGDVDAAIENLQKARQPHLAPVVLSVPLRISGLGHDEILMADRATFTLTDAGGNVLYAGSRAEHSAQALLPDQSRSAVTLQKFEIPAPVYKQIAARVASVTIDYSLTVRAVVGQHRLPANEGEMRSPEVGLCKTNADPSAAYLRCKQIGHAPNCYAATLYGPEGKHNPQVLTCQSDYRPFIPVPLQIINFNGIDMPIRDNYGVAHYDVDGSDLADSYIVLKVYETGQHFRRTVVSHFNASSTASQAVGRPFSLATCQPNKPARSA
jgi:hypothetical protein